MLSLASAESHCGLAATREFRRVKDASFRLFPGVRTAASSLACSHDSRVRCTAVLRAMQATTRVPVQVVLPDLCTQTGEARAATGAQTHKEF